MENKDNKSVTMEDMQIVYRNFEGAESMYNVKGNRNFSVILPMDIARKMAADGWNVKIKEPEDGEGEPFAHLSVAVSYKNRPPTVVMITERSRTLLNEDSIEVLDYADISQVDLIVNPYHWEMRDGKTGIKAYLKSLYVIIDEDDLARKYALGRD